MVTLPYIFLSQEQEQQTNVPVKDLTSVVTIPITCTLEPLNIRIPNLFFRTFLHPVLLLLNVMGEITGSWTQSTTSFMALSNSTPWSMFSTCYTSWPLCCSCSRPSYAGPYPPRLAGLLNLRMVQPVLIPLLQHNQGPLQASTIWICACQHDVRVELCLPKCMKFSLFADDKIPITRRINLFVLNKCSKINKLILLLLHC